MEIDELRSHVEVVEDGVVREQDLSRVESAIGAKIPEPLRSLISDYDSFYFAYDEATESGAGIHANGESFDLSVFFGALGKKYCLVDAYQLTDSYARLGLVPFAKDSFGNRFVWSKVTGQISFIDFDRFSGAKGPQLIADSMPAFFASICYAGHESDKVS